MHVLSQIHAPVQGTYCSIMAVHPWSSFLLHDCGVVRCAGWLSLCSLALPHVSTRAKFMFCLRFMRLSKVRTALSWPCTHGHLFCFTIVVWCDVLCGCPCAHWPCPMSPHLLNARPISDSCACPRYVLLYHGRAPMVIFFASRLWCGAMCWVAVPVLIGLAPCLHTG